MTEAETRLCSRCRRELSAEDEDIEDASSKTKSKLPDDFGVYVTVALIVIIATVVTLIKILVQKSLDEKE